MNNSLSGAVACLGHEQVYLLERDAGLLCRVLGLYSARSLDVHFQVEHAGLCLSDLEPAVGAEQLARSTLQRLRRPH